MREVEERTCISIEKSLNFEKSGETFSVKICLENISPELKEDSISPYLETLFLKAIKDLKLNNS